MNYPLYKSFHARGLTQERLATLTGINRSVLARILTNEPGRGKETRHKIIPHLAFREIRILGWEKEFRQLNRTLAAAGATCSTSNIVPSN